MGRSPCCSKEGLNRGAWTADEDKILREYITLHGEGRWRNLPKTAGISFFTLYLLTKQSYNFVFKHMHAGLKRCGKSCRLRWLNYLRPDIKRGNITSDEEELIIRLHKLLGNRSPFPTYLNKFKLFKIKDFNRREGCVILCVDGL